MYSVPDTSRVMIGPVRVRALLIDLDGTLYTNGGPVQGAREALKRLDRAGVLYRFITNATHKPRREVAAYLKTLGFSAEEGLIFTPATAVVERLRGEGVGCYGLLVDALLEDLEGIPTTGNSPGYVLVGNLGQGFTYRRLDAAFRHLVAGAELIALSKNRYWQTGGGEFSLDAGPFVAALEYASGKTATVVGKPEKDFFRLALEDLGLEAHEVAMVGDDPESDVAGAKDAGLKGVQVKTGKYDAAAGTSGEADLVLESFAALPEVLGLGKS